METLAIPTPPRWPFLGTLLEFKKDDSVGSTTTRLTKEYGPIYRMWLGSRPLVTITDYNLIHSVCADKRFSKTVQLVHEELRNGAGDGLFTAYNSEPNWEKAHRILIPAFGPLSIRGMFDEMYDIASQLVLKFARHGPHERIDASGDFTRLALDTLALCTMDYRFNSFYRDDMHPFVKSMLGFLGGADVRNLRPNFMPAWWYKAQDEQYFADIELMRRISDDVVANRRKSPNGRKDLLASMLEGTDSKTGEKLSDENITNQLITFLVAGHETTSGLLSFTFYFLLKNPETYAKVKQEVDEVVGRSRLTVDHLGKLKYISAAIRETLRLRPTVPIIVVASDKEDALIGGKYLIPKGEPVSIFFPTLHTDPRVYGDDALSYNPERMLDANFDQRNKEFPDCWKPFGAGKRACIGRPFVQQEAVLAIALLVQCFDMSMADPEYELLVREAGSQKPDQFFMCARTRHGLSPTQLEESLARGGLGVAREMDTNSTTESSAKRPMRIYYGSDSGTCETMARRLASNAARHGYQPSAVGPLDSATDSLATDQPVVIITASYEGEPPSNATKFVSWVEGLKGTALSGVPFAVYGCGHHDWSQTFHRIPKLVDATLGELGGDRIAPIGLTNAAERDMFSDFETWEDTVFWPAVEAKYGATEATDHVGLEVEMTSERRTLLKHEVKEGVVLAETALCGGEAPKRHIDIQLPEGMTYRVGDYLNVLPMNPKKNVERVFRRFKLPRDATLRISGECHTHLPTNVPIGASELLESYVELGQPATKRDVKTLEDAARDEIERKELAMKASPAGFQRVSSRKMTVLELLECFPSVDLSLGTYLSMLPPMHIRQYSISSSPLVDPTRASLTYSLLDAPSLSLHGQHIGVATNFLARLRPGDSLPIAVRSSHASFHLPDTSTPIICIAAGSGIAPMRGFIQERAAIKDSAPALLFFGCRRQGDDDLYKKAFDAWQAKGVVDVRRAYSREEGNCKYVQDRMKLDKDDLLAMWDKGAKVFVCGSREVGRGVEDVFVRMVLERDGLGEVEERMEAWWKENRHTRFATDVFD